MAETMAPFTIARRWNDFLECPQGTARSTTLARAKSFNASPNHNKNKSNNARNIDRESVSIWELFRADVEGVKASVPSVRCSRRSSSDSASFSPDLSLWKPLRPRLTPADWTARIRSSLFERLKNGMSRCLPAKPWLMSRYFSSCRMGLPR